jgi:valyl-tRNA synthetase
VERERLQKQIDKLSKELQGISGKLKNENFLKNAKTEVVDKEREKYNEVNTKLELIKQQLQDLS